MLVFCLPFPYPPTQVAGQHIGLCAPAVPRTAGPSSASCALPALLPGNITAEDCVPWRNGPQPADRADAIPPVCPIDAAATVFATCNARDCEPINRTACPATSPEVRCLWVDGLYVATLQDCVVRITPMQRACQ